MKGELIKHLRGLANGSIKPVDESKGICFEIKHVYNGYSPIIMACMYIMKGHPESSGSFAYPIPHPTLSPDDAYDSALSLWDKETTYGKRRLAMCDYVADKQEEMK